MANRITNSMMYSSLYANMQSNLAEMLRLQDQMTSKKLYSKISDNPVAVARGLGLNTAMFENEQYIKNQQDAVSWLQASYNMFDNLLNDAQRIRELVIYAGDGALSDEQLQAISIEIQQLKESMRNTANTQIAGKYLLSGLDTGTKPFTFDAFGKIVYNGSDKNINFEIEKGVVSQVSFNGTEVFGDAYESYNVKSHYVPLDWTWTGRSEKIEIRLGDNNYVYIQIPEVWIDEIANGSTDYNDYNKFRDEGELRGITMDQLAELFSRAIEEGGASKLIGVSVEKDVVSNVQRLVFTSNTGEPLQITGWPNTDMAPLEQSIAGLAIDIGSVDWNSNVLMGDKHVTFPANPMTFDISIGGSISTITLSNAPYSDFATLLSDLNAALPANVQASEVNGQLVLKSQADQEIRVSGAGAAALFGNIDRSVPPETKGLMGALNASGWISDKMGKSITITANGKEYDFKLDNYSNIYDLVNDMNLKIVPMSGEPDVASIINGRVSLQISGDISVADTAGEPAGGTEQIFGFDSATGTASSLSFRVGDSNPVQLFMSAEDTLESIALKIESITGIAASVSTDGTQLLIVAKRDRAYPEDFLDTNVAAEMLAYPKFSIAATGAAVQLFDFQLTIDTTTENISAITASEEARRAVDHSHIDLLSYLGMETAMKSVEFQAGEKLIVGSEGLHWRISSGNNVVDLKLSQGEYTMEQLAERLNNAGLGWLNVTVSNFVAPGKPSQDSTETGIGTGNNYEGATSRLVIKATQNKPVIFLDMNDSGYADMMGLSTAIRTDNNSNNVIFPGADCLDPNTPAYLKVVVGDGKTYTVKLSQKDVLISGIDEVDRNKVMEQIAKQVNEQSGMELLKVIKSIDSNGNTQSSLFSTTGEPVSIIDLPIPDSSWNDYSMGIATQMGIHTGITATPAMLDNDIAGSFGGPGTIRIRSMGQAIDIDVLATDTVKDILDKIRDQAGFWLEINYYDPEMSIDGSEVMFSICAKDGSAVSIYDLSGDVAKSLECDNAINGTIDLTNPANWQTFTDGDVLTINVAGYSHTIDLYAAQQSVDNFAPQDLASLINARFQDEDLRAEINNDGEIILYSPRGYNIEAGGTFSASTNDKAADIFGTALTNAKRGGAANSINNQQNITVRSGANTMQANFFDVLNNLSATMEAENRQALGNYLLDQVDSFIDNLLKCMATQGALENRYTNNVYRFQMNNTSMTELYDQVVGVDLSKVATDYAMMSAVYEATLAAASMVIQPTLLDYLR